MSFEGTISRKKALAAAETAVDKTNQLVASHNETIEEVARTRKGLEALQADLTRRMDAQLVMIQGCEKQIGDHRTHVRKLADEQRDYVDAQDRAINGRVAAVTETTAEHRQVIARFLLMSFVDRLKFFLFGPGMVSVGEPGTRAASSLAGGDALNRHETPRPIKTARDRESAEALCR